MQALNLSPVGKSTISSASHAKNKVPYYKVAVQITHQRITSQKLTPEGNIIPMNIVNTPVSGLSIIEAVEFVGSTDFDVLIGMDIISTGLVILSGVDQRLTISF